MVKEGNGNLDIVIYIISSLPRLLHTALTVFGKDSIIISHIRIWCNYRPKIF